MGLSLSVTCAAESLVFYFLPQILRLGIRRCIHAVFAAFLLRMGCYAALSSAPSPWMVRAGRLVVQALCMPWRPGVPQVLLSATPLTLLAALHTHRCYRLKSSTALHLPWPVSAWREEEKHATPPMLEKCIRLECISW